MELKEVIAARRSIRKFKPDPIPDGVVNELLEAARLAPSGTNLQPWRFVIVKSPEMREKLSAAIFLRFITQAPVLFVCCADLTATRLTGNRLVELKEAGAFAGTDLENFDPASYPVREMEAEAAKAYVSLNVAIAVEHLVLRATDLGLGSCWTMMFRPKKVKEILDLDENLHVVTIVPVGYPDHSPGPRPRLPVESIVVKTL
ncbi:MAG: nitroreductase family protein [Bacillota bacterium]